ncbi:hypothetical protein KSP39_PZI002446 [Platanthera zijinensis]|uniref:Uncharacterized protein n=1 Tax=Platanthera zijinensis TaxID=2320716 RepID=A0AAP0C0U8_9ASPA
MAAPSSSSNLRIICASFNQDNSCFAVGTKDGFRLFDAQSGRLRYERGEIYYPLLFFCFCYQCICSAKATEFLTTEECLEGGRRGTLFYSNPS